MATFTLRTWVDPVVALPADQSRLATRRAPATVRAAIDRQREQRGLSPLFSGGGATATLPPPAKRDTAGKRYCGTLVGLACPGRSNPVRTRNDGELVKEVILADAFSESIKEARSGGRAISLKLGHATDAAVLASTSAVAGCEASMRFINHGWRGPVVIAHLEDTPSNRKLLERALKAKPHEFGLSVEFTSVEQCVGDVCGERTRVIHRGLLQAVALLTPDSGDRPAYRTSRVVALRSTDFKEIWRAVVDRLCLDK